jgi:DNA-binding beta-propeller fold protein YncE
MIDRRSQCRMKAFDNGERTVMISARLQQFMRRLRTTATPVLTAAIALGFAPVPAAANTAGGFGQIEGPGGCLLDAGAPATSQCGAGEGLFHPKSVAVSPDGRNIYVVGGIAGDNVAQSFGGIAILKRDPATGEIAPDGCLSSDGTDGRDGATGVCASTPSLLGADSVTVSSNGQTVFVGASSSGSVVAFTREPSSGALSRLGCYQATPRPGSPCTPADLFGGSDDLLTSADDSTLYLASPLEGAISALTAPALRPQTQPTEGGITPSPTVSSLFTATPGPFTANPCIAVNGLDGVCKVGVAMRGAGSLTLSPEGGQLYAVASGSNAIDVFAGLGVEGFHQIGCLMPSAPPGLCTSSRFLQLPTSLTFGPNARFAYVADRSDGEGRIDILARSPSSGLLSDVGCVDYLPVPVKPEPGENEGEEHEAGEAPETAKEPPDPCTSLPGLEGVLKIALNAEGTQLYALGSSSAVSFAVNPDSGALTELGCASSNDPRCAPAPDLSDVEAAAISPDGRNLYAVTAGDKAVLAFGIGAAASSRASAATLRPVASVAVACPVRLARPCRGRVLLTRVVTRATRVRVRRHGRRPRHALRVTVARSHWFVIAPGHRAEVALQLDAATYHLLGKRRRLAITASVRSARGAGASDFGAQLLLALTPRNT